MLNMYFDEQVGAGAPLDEGFASVKPIIMFTKLREHFQYVFFRALPKLPLCCVKFNMQFILQIHSENIKYIVAFGTGGLLHKSVGAPGEVFIPKQISRKCLTLIFIS